MSRDKRPGFLNWFGDLLGGMIEAVLDFDGLAAIFDLFG